MCSEGRWPVGFEGTAMRRVWIALRVFWLALVSGATARRVEEEILARPALPGAEGTVAPSPADKTVKPAAKPKPEARRVVRSEALTLLAALQREARFVDFVKEPLAGYSDAQVAAAARDIHRDCGAVLERFFGLVPIAAQEEGSPLEVPAGYDPARYRLTGNVTGSPPYRGRLIHPGWEATRCELPSWSGSEESVRVVAPVEVEI